MDDGTKKEDKGIFSSFTDGFKRKKIDETTEMQEVVVTEKMVETTTKDTVVADQDTIITAEYPIDPPKSKVLKKIIDTEEPIYRKSTLFTMAGRPAGVQKYFRGRKK